MKLVATPIEGLFLIEPRVFNDSRGYFFESYSEAFFRENGLQTNWVQDNQSLSQKGVLRGLHFQNPPYAQAKLVRVIRGAVLDVAVDIRKNSPTYGKYFSYELNEENKTMMLIPEGFAHGFLTLSDNTIFAYKCSNVYSKVSEDSLLWNDPDLNISWGDTGNVQLSEKDLQAKSFAGFSSLF